MGTTGDHPDLKRELGARRRAPVTVGITPMIDVVFVLLLFFMVAGRLTEADPFALSPPTSFTEGPPSEVSDMVQIGADGERALDGTIMSEDEIVAEIERRLDADPSRSIRVKADASTPAL
ncbi:MAG: biopolymer transporter ExbD, partial [Pseudomonadota bacterium]